MTLGLNGHTRLAELRRLAALGAAEEPFRKLQQLAGYDQEKLATAKSVGAYIHFITRPDVTGILERWAADSTRARDLLRVSVCLAHRADLIRPLRPVDESTPVTEGLHGTIAAEPLNAAIAERRAVVRDGALRHWLQQLRVLILLRGLELLDLGARSDRHLTVVSNAARKACEKDTSDQLDWMRLVATPSSDLPDFLEDLIYRCDMAAPKRRGRGQVPLSGAAQQFFRSLRRIATGGPWWDPKSLHVRPGASQVPDGGTGPASKGKPATPTAPETLDAEPDDVIVQPPGPGLDIRLLKQNVKQGMTQAQIRKHGTQILLEGAEQHLYLTSSWHQLNADERSALAQRVEELLGGPTLIEQLGATLTVVAWATARGMFDVETLRLSNGSKVDWTLDIAVGLLQRRPPRFSRGVNAVSLSQEAQSWLQPPTEVIEVELSKTATKPLADALLTLDPQQATTIQELWQSLSPDLPLERWFATILADTPELRRLTGPTIGKALARVVFDQTGDATLAQLLSSQSRTALPAATAYCAYRQADVQASLVAALPPALLSVRPPNHGSPLLNAAGSELDVELSKVAAAVTKLADRYEDAAGDHTRWIEAHNLLTSLVVIALLGSTGARPVNSPFESLAWFDFDRRVVYVEDKRSGPTTGARVGVLTEIAGELLNAFYLPHLASLAKLIAHMCPVMAKAIQQTISDSANQSRPLPLLFYLRAAPDFTWLEVSETQLGVQCGSSWPAPWNLFRHILATQLTRRRVDPEIVDALLAHGDRGAESHGDNSLRIPKVDIEVARPHVEAVVSELGLRRPKHTPTLPSKLTGVYIDLKLEDLADYGRKAREQARDQRHEATRSRAVQEIEGLVGGRPPASLTTDEWQAIGNAMLFRETLPHPAAALRYQAFEDWLTGAWHKERALVAVRRRYCPVAPPQSLFTPEFIHADGTLEAAVVDFRQATAGVDLHGARTPGPMLAAALGAFELVLTSFVCHMPLLLDLIHLRRNVRLVRFEGRFWFERANADVWEDGRPVMRVQVSGRAARWIGIALDSSRRSVKDAPVPPLLQPWIAAHIPGAATLRSALANLCGLRSQSNAWHLSGVEAAHLAGRQIVTALPHHDWFRLSKGRAPLMGEPIEASPEFETDDVAFEVPVGRPGSPSGVGETAKRCAILLDGITKAFETKSDSAGVLAEIRRLTADSGFQKGDAPQVLAHFACVLLTRKRRTGERVRLRFNTARRYWYSLVEPFVDLGHDRFLPDEDEESIREFYEDVVHWWEMNPEKANSTEPAETQDNDTTATPDDVAASKHHDAMRRTVAQLKDFHDFAVNAYGLEDVDWSGIDLGLRVAVGRPGLILLSEIEAALAAILGGHAPQELVDERVAAAFVLIACGRFGLRVSEAVGMYRDDWLDWSGAVVVLVQSNSVRSLKTAHSRRQVPLVERLSELEQSVVDEAMRRWDLAHKSRSSAPLLPGVTKDTYWSVKAAVSSLLLQVLKLATGSSAARIHGLRHSFACRLLALLTGRSPGAGISASTEASTHARRLLLGRDRVDRRLIWAIARALGHARPSTTISCYLHGIEHWAKTADAQEQWTGAGVLMDAFIDLDELSTDTQYGQPIQLPETPALPRASLALRRIRFLALLQAGYKRDRARLTSGLSLGEAAELEARLQALPLEKASESDDSAAGHLLASISFKRWQALVEMVMEVQCDILTLPSSMDALGVPIGPRRHLILHRHHHFRAVADFISALRLTSKDLIIVPTAAMSAVKREWILELQLGEYLFPVRQLGKDFRLDTVEWGDPPEPVQHRAALIPFSKPAGRIANTQELLVLWVVMHSFGPP